ncbi:MAG: FGGY family carbohydrate kinase [Thermodesulfobacteriota bacterium]
MKAEPLLAGIDIGTSTLKVCVYSTSGKLVWQDYDHIILRTPCPNCVEMDLIDLSAKLKSLLQKMAAGHAAEIEAIGFSVTNPTLVVLDKDLNAIRPGIPFLDTRCTEEVTHIVDSMGGPEQYFKKAGNQPSPSTCTTGLLKHIKRCEPEIWSRSHKIGFLNTYLAAQFTGAVICDPTTASYSGLLDVRKPFAWDEELIKIANIAKELLPDLKPSCHKAGGLRPSWARSTGLKAGIPVAIGSGDTAAAAFALGMTQHGEVFESMGTSEVLSFCLHHPDLDMAFMNRSHVIPGLWLSHGAISTSGAAIAWLKKNVFPEIPNLSLLEEKALKAPPGANGLMFLPYLAGERSPIFDPKACGAFLGLTLNSNRADMIRAVYEGAGYAIKQIYILGSSKWKTRPQTIKCVGGAATSLLALQIRADMLGTELACIETENAAAYGAAMMGGLAGGIYPDFEAVPFLNAISRQITPHPNRMRIYDQYFAVYNDLYPRLKPSMHKLRNLMQ